MKEDFVLKIINDLKPGGLALDIGAHYGEYTTILASKFAQVFAFEPLRYNGAILAENVKDCKNVFIVSKAISDHNGVTRFWPCSRNDGGGTVNEEVAATGKYGHELETYANIKCTTIDNFIGDNSVDFIKMDIEGAEDFVWPSAQETIDISPNLKIVLETHKHINGLKLYQFFIKNGFTIFPDHDTLREDTHYFMEKLK